MATIIDCDALIVGAGPTGMTLGLLLARDGLDTLVIDKASEVYPLPRAAHIDHETMRTFQRLGLAEAIAATCRTAPSYDFLTASGEVLMRFDGLDQIGPGGWPVGNMIHQPSLEGILRDAACLQMGLRLNTNWRFNTYAQHPDAVIAEIETPHGEVSVRCRYLVGADGARSAVRTSADIQLEDLQFDEQWLVIDAIVHDFERLPKINLQICDPARPTTCVLMGSGRHRWEFMLKPGESAEEIIAENTVARLMAPWNVDGAVTIERKVVYRFNAKVARAWKKGRILLAGDAAHLTPPFAGQGLCAGIRDAANLGWKLPAVVRGKADDRLLETYQSEREPHARALIDLAMMMGRTVCIADPEAARRRDTQMLEMRRLGGATPPPPILSLGSGCVMEGAPAAGAYFPQFAASKQKLDEVLGSRAWLLTRAPAPKAEDSALRQTCLADQILAPFSPRLHDWLEHHRSEAVLVRPDRYVFGAGDARVLMTAWRRWRSGDTAELRNDKP